MPLVLGFTSYGIFCENPKVQQKSYTTSGLIVIADNFDAAESFANCDRQQNAVHDFCKNGRDGVD